MASLYPLLHVYYECQCVGDRCFGLWGTMRWWALSSCWWWGPGSHTTCCRPAMPTSVWSDCHAALLPSPPGSSPWSAATAVHLNTAPMNSHALSTSTYWYLRKNLPGIKLMLVWIEETSWSLLYGLRKRSGVTSSWILNLLGEKINYCWQNLLLFYWFRSHSMSAVPVYHSLTSSPSAYRTPVSCECQMFLWKTRQLSSVKWSTSCQRATRNTAWPLSLLS